MCALRLRKRAPLSALKHILLDWSSYFVKALPHPRPRPRTGAGRRGSFAGWRLQCKRYPANHIFPLPGRGAGGMRSLVEGFPLAEEDVDLVLGLDVVLAEDLDALRVGGRGL